MNREKPHSLYLLDGHALCYRAYYAIRDLKTSRGMPTNAIYGFINILRKIIRDYGPDMMAVAFDTKAPTKRHRKYESYKIHRKAMPDDLAQQIPKIKEVLNACRIPIYQLEGYEADDIIATVASKAKGKGIEVTIITSDKDALQLVDEGITVINPHSLNEKYYGPKETEEKFGVKPAFMVDLMALVGDASDNIPGVNGIGAHAASKLINQYKTLEGIYKNIDKISSVSLREKLMNAKETAQLSYDLAKLDSSVPVEIDLEAARLREPDEGRLADIYRELEFEKLLREIMPQEEKSADYALVEDEKKLKDIIRLFLEKGMVSLGVDEDHNAAGSVFIAVSCAEGKGWLVPADKAREILENEAIKKIGHDLKKIIILLRKHGLAVKGEIFDVMMADYLLDPSHSGYDLKSIAMRQLNYNFQHGAPSVKSNASLRLYFRLKDLLKEKHLLPLFNDVEMPLVGVLADMEYEGVDIDIEYLEKQSALMGDELGRITEKIYNLAGETFNVNSPKQLGGVLYEKLKLPVVKRTKTGPSTDESVLRKLASLHELPKILLEYREMSKLKSTYYDSILALVDRKSRRLHARFNQAVTSTGRLSSSEPNLQNIPVKTSLGKALRRGFIAGGENELLLAADYSQIELHILAHLSGDGELIKSFKKGEDIHCATAAGIFNCRPGDVTSRMRMAAKQVNFGIIYGMSAFGLAKSLDISVEGAQKFIDAYFKKYSGVKSFIEKTIKDAREKGYVTTLLNRRRYIPEIISANEHLRGFAERVAVNTPVQGSAADLIKAAMVSCHRELDARSVRMLIQVHDELIFKLSGKALKETAVKIKNIMENVIELRVSLMVDMEAGKNWLDMTPVQDLG